LDVFVGRQKKSNDSRINLSALLHVSKTGSKPKIAAKIVPFPQWQHAQVGFCVHVVNCKKKEKNGLTQN